ncbi:MAG: glycoside hydrolase family 32 protein [Blautia sp.]|nr:glycoside hydrolase family 32 protein [Blautia sp.]
MISQTLREARKYEEVFEKMIPEEGRPAFHLTPRVGWMNDPNGFCRYQGKYHMFYQYYPFASHWDSMHWGHAVSEDLLHWTAVPAALAPDEAYDYNGCFSGSAIEMKDGKHLLMYTGVRLEIGKDGRKHEVQTQCVAIGDGVDYEKYSQNPVLDESDLPEGASRQDFRDPKMIRRKDGSLISLIGSRPADGSGQILIYKSQDGISWKYWKTLIKNECRYGKMWECPDFFELDGKWVLLTSPQDMLPEGFEYHNGNGTLCVIGTCDEENMDFTEEHNQSIDYGIDFYAPQTVLTEDGRRVMIGWMQNWDACAMREPEDPWAGQMSLPRELSIRNGRLYQWPIREIEDMRCNPVSFENVIISGKQQFEGISGRRIDMELEIEPVPGEELFQKFSVWFAQNKTYHTGVSFRPLESTLKIDRKFSGSRRAIVHQRRAKVYAPDHKIRLRLILDRYSAEVFINDGEQVMSATLYTPQEANGISFQTIGGGRARINVRKWDLR